MKRIAKIFGTLLLFLTLGGCLGGGTTPGGGTDNPATPTPPVPVFGNFVLGVAASNPATSTSLNLQGGSIRQNSATFRENSVALFQDSIRIEETRNAVSEISFEPDGNDNGDIEFPGTYVVLLVRNGGVVNLEFPDFGVTTIPFDTYHKFEMKFSRLEQGQIPAELLQDPLVNAGLVDQSVRIEGSFIESADNDIDGSGGVSYINFRILSDVEAEIEVSSPNLFTVSSDRVNYFFIAFRLETWFSGLLEKFQSLTANDLTNGVAVISDQSSSQIVKEILDTFERNLEGSCKSAPSDDDRFEEEDVDEDSSSGSI